MNILKSEKVSAYSHGALIPVMVTGTVVLAVLAGKNLTLQFFSLVYGISATLLFTASFLYHAKKKSENERTVWRKLDRSAIFLLIAGTYTPMCFLYLQGTMMRGILIAQWLLVLSGIYISFFTNAHRKISTMIYLMMGWVVVIPFKSMIAVMPSGILMLLIAGGISYTLGALVYAFKKPNPLPPYMGFHEVFHVFVNAGALLHLLMVIGSVTIYTQA